MNGGALWINRNEKDPLFVQILIEPLTKFRDKVLDAYASTNQFEFLKQPF